MAPDFSLHDWFNQRGRDQAQGIVTQPDVTFALSGQANNGKPIWNWDYRNLAPQRLPVDPEPDHIEAPDPNGQRNHGRGSTPVASMTARSPAAMSERRPRAPSSGILA